jgi:solute:Na+ symporter, SSS family
MFSGLVIFLALVAVVTVMGFAAARWGHANLEHFEQWALGGRGFGTVVTWFLLGGDLYTAYTFIALPALASGQGAFAFFALPFTLMGFPIVFFAMSRFWVVAQNRGHITIADFVRDRFGSRWLEKAIAITGCVGVLPYIALQLIGMQIVFAQFGGARAVLAERAALVIAFGILAAYTYTSGLRAPAMIAFVKDTLIYVTVVAAVAIIPAKLGGWAHVFAGAGAALAAHKPPASLLLAREQYFGFSTAALGSALAIGLYPHAVTSLLSAKSKLVIQRNAALLPLYSILLGLLALMGYCALAAGIHPKDANATIPLLFKAFFPDWLVGIAFAAIVVGALVPAAMMAIGSANLLASNVLNEFSKERPAFETRKAKLICLVVCGAGLLVALFLPVQYAIYLQLLGGCLILQTVPSTMLALFTRWMHPKALLGGWACGVISSSWMAYATGFKVLFPLPLGGGHVMLGYIGLYALLLNLVVTAVLTPLFAASNVPGGLDSTTVADYA